MDLGTCFRFHFKKISYTHKNISTKYISSSKLELVYIELTLDSPLRGQEQGLRKKHISLKLATRPPWAAQNCYQILHNKTKL